MKNILIRAGMSPFDTFDVPHILLNNTCHFLDRSESRQQQVVPYERSI